MKRRKKIVGIGCASVLVLFVVFFNQWLEIIAFHPFFGSDEHGLKVMTWNVHCSYGTDEIRQKEIAKLILHENADFVLLNEYNQDSCQIIDSLLKCNYTYIVESQSPRKCGDIFYSKKEISDFGYLKLRKIWEAFLAKDGETFPDSLKRKPLPIIRATIAIGKDSVQIFGMHLTSNSGDGSAIVNSVDSLKKIDNFYKRYQMAQKHRCFQAYWTKEVIQNSKHPVIAMGDMNDFNCSEPLNIFAYCGLRDSWWEGGLGYGCTFHSGWYRFRIDHILHSEGLKLTNIKVISTNMSDHNPMVATFKLN